MISKCMKNPFASCGIILIHLWLYTWFDGLIIYTYNIFIVQGEIIS